MRKLVIDITYIRQKSVDVELNKLDSIVQDLKDSFTDRTIGLTAIQIGINKTYKIHLSHFLLKSGWS